LLCNYRLLSDSAGDTVDKAHQSGEVGKWGAGHSSLSSFTAVTVCSVAYVPTVLR
jgi:hypothetical protein